MVRLTALASLGLALFTLAEAATRGSGGGERGQRGKGVVNSMVVSQQNVASAVVGGKGSLVVAGSSVVVGPTGRPYQGAGAKPASTTTPSDTSIGGTTGTNPTGLEAGSTLLFRNNHGSISFTIVYTCNAGMPFTPPNMIIGPGQTATSSDLTGWAGRFYATFNGITAASNRLVIGEVTFGNSASDTTFYDVSYIDTCCASTPNDASCCVQDGVHWMSSKTGTSSGCDIFDASCTTAYENPPDEQTQPGLGQIVVSLS